MVFGGSRKIRVNKKIIMQFRFVNVVVDLKSAKVSEMQPAPSHLVKNEISLK